MPSTISFRIPEELKRRMKRIRNVNWSEVVRRALRDRIAIEEKIEGKDWSRVERAVEEADKLRQRLEAKHGRCDYDSAATIRSWRDART